MEAGQNLGVLLRGLKSEQIERGMCICPPNTSHAFNRFKAQVYFLTKHEGGRAKPIRSGYCQQLFSHTWDVEARFDLPLGMDMMMPGDNAELYGTLLKEMVLEESQRFTIRENHQTVGTGVITKILNSVTVEKQLGRLDAEKMRTDNGGVVLVNKAKR